MRAASTPFWQRLSRTGRVNQLQTSRRRARSPIRKRIRPYGWRLSEAARTIPRVGPLKGADSSYAVSAFGKAGGQFDAWVPGRTTAQCTGADDREIRLRPQRFPLLSPG